MSEQPAAVPVPSRGNRAAALSSVLLALLALGVSAFYWTQQTNALATVTGIHYRRAAAALLIGLVALAVAFFTRPRAA